MAAQRFTDPTMPFHREVHNGCAIGTSIVIQATAYQDQKRSLEVQLKTRNDIALNLIIPTNKPGQLAANARINDQYTSEIQKAIHIPINTPFALHIRMDRHVSEIYFNDTHLLDFVHRINPLEIKEVSIEGPVTLAEVVFKPPQGASLEPLPSYDEAAKSVVPEFSNLSIGPTASVPPTYRQSIPPPPSIQPPPIPAAERSGPPPAGTVVPRGAAVAGNKPPYPEKGYPGGAPALPEKKTQPGGPGNLPYIPHPSQQQQQPIAQVAPQPIAPPMSNIGVQNTTPTWPTSKPDPKPYPGPEAPAVARQYPQQGSAPQPYPGPQQGYPQPGAGSQQYPQPGAGSQQYPQRGAPPQPYPQPGATAQQYPPPAQPGQPYQPQPGQPGGYAPGQYPTAPPATSGAPNNVYPGPNPPPTMYNPYQAGPSTQYPYGQQPAYPVYQQQGYPTYVAPTYPVYSYPSYYDDCHVSSYCYPQYYPSSYYDSCHHHHHHC